MALAIAAAMTMAMALAVALAMTVALPIAMINGMTIAMAMVDSEHVYGTGYHYGYV